MYHCNYVSRNFVPQENGKNSHDKSTFQQGPHEPDFFFWGGGGGGVGEAEACYPGKIRVLVTLRYRKADLKSTNSVLKGHCHEHNLKNPTAQKHVYTIGKLLTVVKFSLNYYTSVLKLNIE